MVIIIIVLLLMLIFITYKVIRYKRYKKALITNMAIRSTIVFGPKGSGKDLFFQWLINVCKRPYLSNQNYGGKKKIISIGDLSVSPNTYEDFINNKVIVRDKIRGFENKNVYLTDVGVFLPSQYDYLIHKKFPSLSIFYALSRHLYNMAIHCNTQNLERVFKGLREQADFFVHCRGVMRLPFGLLMIKVCIYDKYASALSRISPLKLRKGLFGGKNEQILADFNSKHGLVKDGYILIHKKHIYYDTRAFHKTIFGRKIKK